MSDHVATQLTAVFTGVLAVGAIVTAILAFFAFHAQSKEVRLLQRQAQDQADLLKIQHDQFLEQQKINEKQTDVLGLQAQELRGSLDERKREAADRRRAQASHVLIWQDVKREAREHQPSSTPGKVDLASSSRQVTLITHVLNTSEQPVYELTIMSTDGSTTFTTKMEEEVLLPGADIKHSRWAEAPNHGSPNRDLYDAKVEFRDSAGVRWLRRPGGKLTELLNRTPQHAVTEQTSRPE